MIPVLLAAAVPVTLLFLFSLFFLFKKQERGVSIRTGTVRPPAEKLFFRAAHASRAPLLSPMSLPNRKKEGRLREARSCCRSCTWISWTREH